MEKETRTAQEVIVDLKLGTSFSPNNLTNFTWGRWPVDSEEGNWSIILTTRTDLPEKSVHESRPLTKNEAVEKISEYLKNLTTNN